MISHTKQTSGRKSGENDWYYAHLSFFFVRFLLFKGYVSFFRPHNCEAESRLR